MGGVGVWVFLLTLPPPNNPSEIDGATFLIGMFVVALVSLGLTIYVLCRNRESLKASHLKARMGQEYVGYDEQDKQAVSRAKYLWVMGQVGGPGAHSPP